jgi:hypothetical protein
MPTLRLGRRAVLRGGGSLAIALPWLEVMSSAPARAQAGAKPAQRFVAVYTPGGTVQSRWRPSGTETVFTLGPILRPLEKVKDKVLVVGGLNMNSARGEQHQAGIVAFLSGTPQSGSHRSYASGPSVDQVIASRISRGKKRKASVQVAVRWATGKSHGRLHPINSMTFEDNDRFTPIPPGLDPAETWKDLFGTFEPMEAANAASRLSRKKSILDYVGRRYETLSRRVGAGDRRRLEEHLTRVRELERSLQSLRDDPGRTCAAPRLVDTADYNPRSGLRSSDNGSIRDTSTDAAIPKVGKLFMDMLVMALACDITAVGSLQWSDTEAKHTFPWLGLREHHHYYQHDGGFRPAECEKIGTWYSEQHAYLLSRMDAVDMGGHSLLDESVVFFGSELADPPSHRKTDMPFLVAGRGGGLRSGRWVRYGGRSHNDLLVSLLNLFGDDRKTFGDPRSCAGPLPGLV